ncbi:DUF4190 domain-containing protein [Streptomyces sp. NPDC087512]|uniref:DUF4190 domain-containing protein n=1 Tax=Streptomyces sp. NPDC087512 TaxID=3155059 RepID=UPI0034412A3E
MSDDAKPARADAHAPEAAGTGPASRPAPHDAAGTGGTWATPGGGPHDGPSDAVPGTVGLGKPDPAGGRTPAARGDDPWAPPADGAAPASGGGPGGTLASNEPSPWAAPSVHDQHTVTSMPAMGAPAPPWTTGSAPAVPPAPVSGGAVPYAPPAPVSGAGDPFAPPHAGQEQAVPPPPIAPDGPGQVPYGYPGQAGYPAPPSQGYYGWPGATPMPSNGPGTAGLVLGIVSAAVFCLWPLAIVLGVLGVVFGAVGRAKATRGEATNPGQALAGVICGIAGIVLGVGFGLLVLLT